MTTTNERFWRTPLDSNSISRTTGRLDIREERCKGCGFCAEFCPCDVLVMSDRFNLKGYHPPDVEAPESCTACHLCEIICPEFAIGVAEIHEEGVGHAG